MFYRTKLGRSMRNRAGVSRGSQKFGGRWAPHLKIGGVSDPRNTYFPTGTTGTTANLVVQG